jgi:hypothetical protein
LRSNDQRVVQLDHALAARGWYLKRREGELRTATPAEKAAIETKIGRSLNDRVIRLKDGAQAYTATFYGQPELAKKNVKKIFASVDDGGHFEKIFSSDMTAEKIAIAHELKKFVDAFLNRFLTLRRKGQKLPVTERVAVYEPVLGTELAEKHSDVIHQVMPQCALFLCGTVFKDLVENQKTDSTGIIEELRARGSQMIQEDLLHIIDFAKNNSDKADRSWPVLLKSNTFFGHTTAYIAGIRRGSTKGQPNEPTP